MLKRRQRVDQALVAVVMETYLYGAGTVSTRTPGSQGDVGRFGAEVDEGGSPPSGPQLTSGSHMSFLAPLQTLHVVRDLKLGRPLTAGVDDAKLVRAVPGNAGRDRPIAGASSTSSVEKQTVAVLAALVLACQPDRGCSRV